MAVTLKSAVKAVCPPFVLRWRRELMARRARRRYERFKGRSAEDVFTEIYQKNLWSSGESVSGAGSELAATRNVRPLLESLVGELELKSLLDVPCGDFHWMKEVDLKGCRYVGCDIVQEIVDRAREKYGSPSRRFARADLLREVLPAADLVLCRDCLFHLSFADVAKAVRQLKAGGSTYLLTTTYPLLAENEDVITGGFRPINLCAPPFNFPPPLKVVTELPDLEPGVRAYGKSLGLWRLADLPDPAWA